LNAACFPARSRSCKFPRYGSTARTFQAEIHARIDFKLLTAVPERVPDKPEGPAQDHVKRSYVH
jgi:hypothetical protein